MHKQWNCENFWLSFFDVFRYFWMFWMRFNYFFYPCLFVCVWHKFYGCLNSKNNLRNIIKRHIHLHLNKNECWFGFGVVSPNRWLCYAVFYMIYMIANVAIFEMEFHKIKFHNQLHFDINWCWLGLGIYHETGDATSVLFIYFLYHFRVNIRAVMRWNLIHM